MISFEEFLIVFVGHLAMVLVESGLWSSRIGNMCSRLQGSFSERPVGSVVEHSVRRSGPPPHAFLHRSGCETRSEMVVRTEGEMPVIPG